MQDVEDMFADPEPLDENAREFLRRCLSSTSAWMETGKLARGDQISYEIRNLVEVPKGLSYRPWSLKMDVLVMQKTTFVTTATSNTLPADWHSYIVIEGVNTRLPGIYEWQIEGVGCLIGDTATSLIQLG